MIGAQDAEPPSWKLPPFPVRAPESLTPTSSYEESGQKMNQTTPYGYGAPGFRCLVANNPPGGCSPDQSVRLMVGHSCFFPLWVSGFSHGDTASFHGASPSSSDPVGGRRTGIPTKEGRGVIMSPSRVPYRWPRRRESCWLVRQRSSLARSERGSPLTLPTWAKAWLVWADH